MAENLQGIDYIYNLAGQLKAINDPGGNDPGNDGNNGISADVFSMTLDYYTGDYNRANIHTATEGNDQYNGNIKAMTWKTNGAVEDDMETYYYDYNKNNWLKSAGFGAPADGSGAAVDHITKSSVISTTTEVLARQSITLLPGFHVVSGTEFLAKIDPNAVGADGGDHNVTNLTYDQNGNILSLNRNKDTQNGNNRMDELSYHYKPNLNQLDHVTDAVTVETNADDIKTQSANNYSYNSIGQLVENVEEQVKYSYNASGLVTEIQKDNQPLVKFYYNDKGYRVRKESFTNGTLTGTDHYVRDAAGNTLAIYNNSTLTEMPIYGASRLGVHYRTSNKDVYQLTDHLGNVRAVIAKNPDPSGDAVISSSTDYYPFGMPMPGRQTIGGELYRYAFQGQEKDPETGKEAFQLRLWDSRIGRWLTTDPKRAGFSPYWGMDNNPISLIDPDGGCPKCPDYNDSDLGDTFIDDDGVEWDFQGNDLGWNSSVYDEFNVYIIMPTRETMLNNYYNFNTETYFLSDRTTYGRGWSSFFDKFKGGGGTRSIGASWFTGTAYSKINTFNDSYYLTVSATLNSKMNIDAKYTNATVFINVDGKRHSFILSVDTNQTVIKQNGSQMLGSVHIRLPIDRTIDKAILNVTGQKDTGIGFVTASQTLNLKIKK